MSPQPLRGVIRRSKAWDSIDKPVLSLSLWQELALWTANSVCLTERGEEAAATACWRINKPLKRCPELTDQDWSNNGRSSVRALSFKFCSVLFTLCLFLSPLFLFFSILPLYLWFSPHPVSLSLLRCVNRGEKEVKTWQALPRITRDINFTFQSLLLSLSPLFCGSPII